ncbi:MAG: 3,4-dihydroxy-2-butanone-4-phosphate synthase [Alphaproteobacteria bacterium]|nr:3,4-dihydroxy-2-butanone-4-phosphate synthase [Alphaproteobacteria bacterium]
MTPVKLDSIDMALADIGAGRMVIIVDDGAPGNHGDLMIAAERATPEAINFMARFARGLVSLALDSDRVRQLHLSLQPRQNEGGRANAYTVSIEAREGISTGISAADRAHTIAVAATSPLGAAAITSPGHIFPLMARDGGVLVRAGHVEASVDLARLAGLRPAAAICEILGEDGSHARLEELRAFGATHGIAIVTIADLIGYRRRREVQVEQVLERTIVSRHGGEFRILVFRNLVDGVEHVALVKGDIGGEEPVLVRIHAVNLLDDIIGDRAYRRGGELHLAMERIGAAGRGVIVLMREAHNSSPSQHLLARDRAVPESGSVIRDYGTGAQILRQVGVRRMILLSRSGRLPVGLQGYDLEIAGVLPTSV